MVGEVICVLTFRLTALILAPSDTGEREKTQRFLHISVTSKIRCVILLPEVLDPRRLNTHDQMASCDGAETFANAGTAFTWLASDMRFKSTVLIC